MTNAPPAVAPESDGIRPGPSTMSRLHFTKAAEAAVGPAVFYDAGDLARLMKVHKTTVYAAAKEGDIPGTVRFRGRFRFNREQVDQWIKDNCPPVRKEAALPALAR